MFGSNSEQLNMVGLAPHYLLSSVVYAFLGLVLMVLFLVIIDRVLNLNFRKELFEDQNVAFGNMIAGFAIALAIIIASAIHG